MYKKFTPFILLLNAFFCDILWGMKTKLTAFFAATICIIAFSLAFSACTLLFGEPHSHEYKETIVAPTCTEKGYTLHECECGDSFKDNYIDEIDHTPVEVGYKAPTCTEDGHTAGTRCSVCGTSIKDSETIGKLGHTTEPLSGKKATCTEDGLTEGEKCSVCGEILKEQQTIPATGHDYSTWTFEREVTCTQSGLRVSICPDCGHRTEEIIKAHGHRARAGAAATAENCVICNTGLFVPRTGNSAYGYYDLHYTQNGAAKQSLYYQIYLACEQVAESKSDLEEMTASKPDGTKFNYYAAAEIDLTGSGLTYEEVYGVWQVFYGENPTYFWMLNNMLFIEKISSGDESSNELVVMVDDEFAAYERRKEAQAAIDEMTAELNVYLGANLTQTQKIVKIHDFIAERITYAYKDDGVTPETELWAHNIMGAAEKKSGVCETYAKTYLYYCLLSGVNCISVVGTAGKAGEGHAWNYIEIDGNWYGVDVTWDDAGKNVTHTYLGANASRMNGEHTPNSAQNYYYDLPELSNTPLSF